MVPHSTKSHPCSARLAVTNWRPICMWPLDMYIKIQFSYLSWKYLEDLTVSDGINNGSSLNKEYVSQFILPPFFKFPTPRNICICNLWTTVYVPSFILLQNFSKSYANKIRSQAGPHLSWKRQMAGLHDLPVSAPVNAVSSAAAWDCAAGHSVAPRPCFSSCRLISQPSRHCCARIEGIYNGTG